MTTKRTLPGTSQQVTQRLVTEKVKTLLGDFEFHVARQRLARRARSATPLFLLLFAQGQVPFFDQSFDQLVKHLFELRPFVPAFILFEHLPDTLFVEQALVH